MKIARWSALFALGAWAGIAGAQTWTVVPKGTLGLIVLENESDRLWLDIRAVGPDWTNSQLTALPATQNGQRVFEQPLTFSTVTGPKNARPLHLREEMTAVGTNQVQVTISCQAEEALNVVGIGPVIMPLAALAGGRVELTTADGVQTIPLPSGQRGDGGAVQKAAIYLPDGQAVTLEFAQPAKVHCDHGEIRLWAIAGKLAAGQAVENQLTLTLPGPAEFEPRNRLVDMRNWYAFQPCQDFSPGSPIGAEGWLDAPAGKHGWLQMDGEHFVFEKQKQPLKFWGTNIAYARMAVEPAQAKEWAEKFAKYGVNIVRYHKWTGNHGWDGVMSQQDFLEFDEPRCRLFDNIHAEMKKRGIYAGWSLLYALKLHESMRPFLKAYDEILQNHKGGMFGGTTYPLTTFAPDVQDLYIAMTVKWLNRTNTVTGLRYADDPAVAYVELHNEADIFFYGTGKLCASIPTYKKIMEEKFCTWLGKKYADDAALRKAWGGDLKKNESLAKKNIFPFPNYNGAIPAPRRVVDSYTFLYEYQNEFYDRYIAAIRKTGYQGPIVGGCWQAADMYGHLFNIASDRRAGFIDRHNYFKGEQPMVGLPGSALLSAGMQQVGDRPFGLSEWAGGHTWGAECQPVIGLIGLGLQGWDYSAQFASGNSIILPDNNGGINGNFDEFSATGQHPFIARFLYSGALKEGEKVACRRISMDELYAGNIGFEERFSLLGGANLKTFAGSVPNEALGAGRVTIDFVDKPAPVKVEMAELAKYWDKPKRLIHASNGQIVWDYAGRGFFTVDTPAAEAVIGFGGGRDHVLPSATIRYDNPFANVYLAAQKPGQTLADAEQVVILTIARTANKGDLYEETGMKPLRRAEQETRPKAGADQRAAHLANPRLVVEPVKATITLGGDRRFKVFALDHDGCKPASPVEVPVSNRQFVLDGAKYQTPYYLVEFSR